MISHRHSFCTCSKCIRNRCLTQEDISHFSSLFCVPVISANNRLEVKYRTWWYVFGVTRSNVLVGVPDISFNRTTQSLRFHVCHSSRERHRIPFALRDGGPILLALVDEDVTDLSIDLKRGILVAVEPGRAILKVGAGFPIPTAPILIGHRRSRRHPNNKAWLPTHP